MSRLRTGTRHRTSTTWRHASLPRATAASLTLLLAACNSTGPSGPATEITLADFAREPDTPQPIVAVPEAVFAPEVETEASVERIGDAVVEREREVVEVETPEGVVAPVVAERSASLVETLPPGREWPVESLVGQINGRPIFAGEFLEPIEARLLRIAAIPDRAEARQAMIELVRARFEEFVDSELVISEAESGLSPEQKQGLFAWLLDMREQEIARRGGNVASAESSVLEEQGLSLEEFMTRRRDIALASDLLRKKIDPRVIVSWRDIEQEYRRREAEFNPPGLVRLGRIRLTERRDGAEAIASVKERLASGEPFAEVAASLDLPDGGFWREFPLPAEGIAGLDLAAPFREAIEGVPVGQAGPPIESATSTTWLAVLSIEQPPAMSLFDPMVQLALREGLRAQQFAIEQRRYLESLRRRWVSDDLATMQARLVAIALERYYR